ncbi:hypothetical protein I4U23_027554 [Adineta vaga]|nr:hypothetical protein I4U23_027554 [Adineta vaga]
MTTAPEYFIIWAHRYISDPTAYHGIKLKFQAVLAPITGFVESPIIYTNNENCALDLIKKYAVEKNVILVSSGSMGHQIISHVIADNLHIHSYYILCTNIMRHIHWAVEYLQMHLNIQMFIHEDDLLVRLVRDISKEFIEEGKNLLTLNDPNAALIRFEQAWALAENVVKHETPSFVFETQCSFIHQQRMLDGDNGLITQAKQAIIAKV